MNNRKTIAIVQAQHDRIYTKAYVKGDTVEIAVYQVPSGKWKIGAFVDGVKANGLIKTWSYTVAHAKARKFAKSI